MSLPYEVVSWLRSLQKEKTEPGFAEAVELLARTLDCEQTKTGLESSVYPKGLEDIFAAGISETFGDGPVSLGERLKKAEQDEKFVAFEDNVKSKGFYDGVAAGSLEHLERRAKLLHKFLERTGSSLSKSVGANSQAKAEEEAEDKKGLGNTAMTAKDYDLAVQFYTEALDLSASGPNSHIYYSNRAAAYCSLKRYNEAIKDCKESLKLVPEFTKAVARLGLAHFYAENYEDSAAAYERALILEPDNKSHSEALAKAKGKISKKQTARRDAPSSSSSSGSSSSSSGAASMSDMMAGMGGLGGAGGLGSLLNDPSMMAMAQNMMKNPAMMSKAQEMMKNPDLMAKAMNMLGGGGGDGAGLDMSALAGMMGGMGGGGDSKKFQGFDE